MKKLIVLSLVLMLVASGATLAQDDERQLRITFSWPTWIDPAVGDDFSSSHALANIYDTMVFPNVAGGVDPHLAESWDVSDDGLVYTFQLRQGIQFHDGTEMLASDIAYSFNRLIAIGEGYAYLMPAASVAALDDYTVQFTLSKPDGLFVPRLVRLYIANEDLVRENTQADGIYGDEGDYGKQWLLSHDAGSGPFMVTDYPQVGYLAMARWDGWWNGATFAENAPDTLTYIDTTEAATVRSLILDDQLEISDAWQTIESLNFFEELDDTHVQAFPSMSSFYYMMNNRLAPLDDVHCRRALAYAYDYEQVVALEWPGTQAMIGPVPQTVGGHNPDVTVYRRDLDKAMEELAQCQYADNIGDYPIDVVWISEVPFEEQFALLFQHNASDIGAVVNVKTVPWTSYVEDASTLETSPHISTIYVSTDLPEAGLMLQQRYTSPTANTWQQNEWLLDEELDQAIADSLLIVDEEARFARYRELQAQIADMSPSLFLYDQLNKHAVKDHVVWTPENNSSVMGYQIFAAHISVNDE
jgi:peptide/nickel transport system substrate-binding protein